MIAHSSEAAATTPRNIPERARKFPETEVLVVDDEHLVRWAIAETLGQSGCHVVEAADAESARRAILAATPPDVVLLDLHLPDSDDLELAALIRRRAPNTSIVLMTAYGTPDILTRAAGLGCSIVIKPFDMCELASIVDRVLAPADA